MIFGLCSPRGGLSAQCCAKGAVSAWSRHDDYRKSMSWRGTAPLPHKEVCPQAVRATAPSMTIFFFPLALEPLPSPQHSTARHIVLARLHSLHLAGSAGACSPRGRAPWARARLPLLPLVDTCSGSNVIRSRRNVQVTCVASPPAHQPTIHVTTEGCLTTCPLPRPGASVTSALLSSLVDRQPGAGVA